MAGTLGGAAARTEWQEFVNCLTTNLTAFFREEHHFPSLAEALQARAGQPLRIWCNAASTGEEPYSIAMTVAEALGAGRGVQDPASDIDTKVLAAAAARRLRRRRARPVARAAARATSCAARGANAGHDPRSSPSWRGWSSSARST